MKSLTDLQHKKLLEMAHKEKQEAEVRLALSWESVMKRIQCNEKNPVR